MHPEIEKLIDLALADGQITEKEKAVIYRKASEFNVSIDKIDEFIIQKLKGIKPNIKGERIGTIIEKEIYNDDDDELVNVSIRVADVDFEPMSYMDANEACYSLGHGWRLPTKTELIAMQEERDVLGMKEDGYWSSSLNEDQDIWVANFAIDEFILSNGSDYNLNSRAVMSV